MELVVIFDHVFFSMLHTHAHAHTHSSKRRLNFALCAAIAITAHEAVSTMAVVHSGTVSLPRRTMLL